MDFVIKLSKMANQIEMTTAEGSRQNIFLNNFNVFGKTPVTSKKTFSFNIGPPEVQRMTKKVKEKILPRTG